MLTKSGEAESRALRHVAEVMLLAARTAPKARGVDNLVTAIVVGKTKDALAAEMRRIAENETGVAFFARDAVNVDHSPYVILLGTKSKPMGLNYCGFCGFDNCQANAAAGAICAYNTHDLGIAVGSAVSVAASHRADNRVMFSVGRAALNLKLLGEDVRVCFGIPLSVTGKSPYYDRK